MHIRLNRSVAVRCKDGEWLTIFHDTIVNYGCKRDGTSMIHSFHVYVRRVKNRIVNHETVTHTTVTPVSETPEWL